MSQSLLSYLRIDTLSPFAPTNSTDSAIQHAVILAQQYS